MRDRYDVLIVGAGPGGLSAAAKLAGHGCRVAVVERNPQVGRKVCAGGITRSGLLNRVPPELLEASFAEQHLSTPRQQCVVTSHGPIIATVDRIALGQWMAGEAVRAGAELFPGTVFIGYENDSAMVVDRGRRKRIVFDHLIGADGANSRVRRQLGLHSRQVGLGLHCQVPGYRTRMEWHLEPALFASGYGWVFPHRESFSIGAFADATLFNGRELRRALMRWTDAVGVDVHGMQVRAGLVNYDYQGHCFGRIWLVGDAAGLASGLTGEGINPACVSGEAVACSILQHTARPSALPALIEQHRRHTRLVRCIRRSKIARAIGIELAVLLLRWKLLDFTALEMAK